MGFFKRKSKKGSKTTVESAPSPDAPNTPAASSALKTDQSTASKNTNSAPVSALPDNVAQAVAATPPTAPTEATLDQIPQLLQDIADDCSGDKPARALRMLFTLSEHSTKNDNRIQMVQSHKYQQLVPALLQFLLDCDRGSSEQYLALLVLNNISIPTENKRPIALQHKGAKILARLLCEDPSIHLMGIVLVNLTFCDSDLRRDLASKDLSLVESMAYALKLSSMTPAEFEEHETLERDQVVTERLQEVILEESKARPATSDLDYNTNIRGKEVLVDPTEQVYPETAKWCLTALKNLTRPSKNGTAAKTLVKTGIMPLILSLVTVGGGKPIVTDAEVMSVSEPTEYINSPLQWDSNSMQDTALFCIMNLAATPETRDSMIRLDSVHLLSLITQFAAVNANDLPDDDVLQVNFQSLKARMALAYLLGSTGHFGQAGGTSTSGLIVTPTTSQDSVLVLTDTETGLLVELLSNTLLNRSKEGSGGYSAATFNVKWILFAVRCLLTHNSNQLRFIACCGTRFNVLLMKALAEHAVKRSPHVDAEAAEYAVFSLYLQSSYGFRSPFLPAFYGNRDNIKGTGSLIAKILTSYIQMESITPAGRHGADQLLLRLHYLQFKGSISDLAVPTMPETDFRLDTELLMATESIHVEKRAKGCQPRDDIFDRPIFRSRVSKGGNTSKTPWDGRTSRRFPSALHAVQELSFGVRHNEAIDEIMVANNIASSANGKTSEAYNYSWSWEDGETQDCYGESQTKSARNSLFGYLACGTLCSADTVTDTTERFVD